MDEGRGRFPAGGPLYKSLLLSINALCASIVWAQSPASSPAPSPPSAQSKLSVHWEELTAADFRDAIARAQGTCLLPFGILEKHGPHGPIGSDLIQSREVAARAAKTEYAVVFPDTDFPVRSVEWDDPMVLDAAALRCGCGHLGDPDLDRAAAALVSAAVRAVVGARMGRRR